MAVNLQAKSNQSSSNASGKERRKADGYLNINLVDKQGNEYKISAVIPLYADSDSKVMRTLMSITDPDKELKIVGRVHLVDSDDASLIEL